jgi:hypothetical protein
LVVWWLWADAIVAQGGAGRKDHQGKELQFFDVLLESQVVVESLRSVTAGALKTLEEGLEITPERRGRQ